MGHLSDLMLDKNKWGSFRVAANYNVDPDVKIIFNDHRKQLELYWHRRWSAKKIYPRDGLFELDCDYV